MFFWCSQITVAQNAVENFLKPSDTLNKKRLKTLVISEVAIGSATLIGLNQIWYADYPRSNFHFINDNAEWLQMDKAGHVFSSYHLGNFGANALKWSGASRKSQLIYGSTLGLAFLTAVEVFDGYSANWGASWGDIAANVSGTALYVSYTAIQFVVGGVFDQYGKYIFQKSHDGKREVFMEDYLEKFIAENSSL